MRTPAQILAALLRARDPASTATAQRYGLTDASVLRRFVTGARRSASGRTSALSYIRNRVLPRAVVRTARKVRAKRASTGDAALDGRLLKARSLDAAAVALARARVPLIVEDEYQVYAEYRLDDAHELFFIAPDRIPDVTSVYVSISTEFGDESAPATSTEDGYGATALFAPLYLPDVLSRLARVRTPGPIKVVIRGKK